MKAKSVKSKKKELKELEKENEMRNKAHKIYVSLMTTGMDNIGSTVDTIKASLKNGIEQKIQEEKEHLSEELIDVQDRILKSVIDINTHGMTVSRADISLQETDELNQFHSVITNFVEVMVSTANQAQQEFGPCSVDENEELCIFSIYANDFELGELISKDGKVWEFEFKDSIGAFICI